MSHALEMYTQPAQYPDIPVPQHEIATAVQQLGAIPGIKLIRAAYRDDDGNYATLADAKLIYECMTGRQVGLHHSNRADSRQQEAQ